MDQTKSLVHTAVISLQRACHVGDCSKLFVVDEQCSSCWRGGFCTCHWEYQFLQCLVYLPKCSIECNILHTYIQLFASFCVRYVFMISCTSLFCATWRWLPQRMTLPVICFLSFSRRKSRRHFFLFFLICSILASLRVSVIIIIFACDSLDCSLDCLKVSMLEVFLNRVFSSPPPLPIFFACDDPSG